jgi:hypothetical protein
VLCATAGQEDPFELDSSLLLSSGRHGEDSKRQYHYNLETPLLVDLADLLYCGIAIKTCLKIHLLNERLKFNVFIIFEFIIKIIKILFIIQYSRMGLFLIILF